MKRNTIIYVVLIFLAAFSMRVAAQHADHHPAQTSQKATAKPEATEPAEMAAHHQEMEKLIDYLFHSLAAMEVEKDPAALKDKLANHRALLEQLQTKVTKCSGMMEQMGEHMKTCPMMKSEHKHQ